MYARFATVLGFLRAGFNINTAEIQGPDTTPISDKLHINKKKRKALFCTIL